MPTRLQAQTPLSLGKTLLLFKEANAPADTWDTYLQIESDSILVSVFVDSITSGDLEVTVYTLTEEGKEVPIISFPTLSVPTVELLLRKAAISLSNVRVRAVTSGVSSFEVRARAVNAGTSSVKIEGATIWSVDKIAVGGTPVDLFGTSFVDRSGLLIKNYQGGGTLFLAESAQKLIDSKGYPLGSGESLAMDLAAGQAVFGESDGPTLDVRLAEAGGT